MTENTQSIKQTLPRGLFVVFEGCDKCGKSTQMELTHKYYSEFYKDYHGHSPSFRPELANPVKMVFPNRTTETGKVIDKYLTSDDEHPTYHDRAIHLLFSSNRWEQANTIHQQLLDRKLILCDRYAYSGVAYSAAKGYDIEWCKQPDSGLPNPDLIFYLYLEPEDMKRRMEEDNEPKERGEQLEFQTLVEKKFRLLMKERDTETHKGSQWIWIDGTLPPDKIQRIIQTQIEAACQEIKDNVIHELWPDM